MKRRPLYLVALAAVAGCTAWTLAGSGNLSAWGDGSGRICTASGQIIVIDNEPDWEAYLAANPEARPYADGDTCTPPTTTTEAPPSTTASTSTPSTIPNSTPESSLATTSVPSSTAPPSSSPSTGSVPHSAPPATPPAPQPTTPSTDGSTTPTASDAATPQTPSSSTVAQLPATGPTDTGTTAAIAAGLVLTGGALVGLRRRAVKP